MPHAQPCAVTYLLAYQRLAVGFAISHVMNASYLPGPAEIAESQTVVDPCRHLLVVASRVRLAKHKQTENQAFPHASY